MKKLNSLVPDKLRGIYFTDPEDKEFKQTIKNAAPFMPCKTSNKSEHGETRGKGAVHKEWENWRKFRRGT